MHLTVTLRPHFDHWVWHTLRHSCQLYEQNIHGSLSDSLIRIRKDGTPDAHEVRKAAAKNDFSHLNPFLEEELFQHRAQSNDVQTAKLVREVGLRRRLDLKQKEETLQFQGILVPTISDSSSRTKVSSTLLLYDVKDSSFTLCLATNQ